ncbi:hypothetical protein GN956_G5912 [Arapaima gigas]
MLLSDYRLCSRRLAQGTRPVTQSRGAGSETTQIQNKLLGMQSFIEQKEGRVTEGTRSSIFDQVKKGHRCHDDRRNTESW